MKAYVVAFGILCAMMVVEYCHADDNHGKPERHMEELQDILKNSMLPEFDNLPRFRRSPEDSDQGGKQGGGPGRGKGPRGGRGGQGGGQGGQGGQGQDQDSQSGQ